MLPLGAFDPAGPTPEYGLFWRHRRKSKKVKAAKKTNASSSSDSNNASESNQFADPFSGELHSRSSRRKEGARGVSAQDLLRLEAQQRRGREAASRTSDSATGAEDVVSHEERSTSRPKHVPIVVPEYEPIAPATPSFTSRNNSFATFSTTSSEVPSLGSFATPDRKPSADSGYLKPRHVEIKIPSWAQPMQKKPYTSPRLSIVPSTFFHAFDDSPETSPVKMSRPTPDSSRTSTMDSNTSAPSPRQLYAGQNNGSNAYLSSMNGSHPSLSGGRDEYESVSDAESVHDGLRSGSHTPSQSQSVEPSLAVGQTPGVGTPNNTANLSGLVCNVHRTTGREPHPLVGATTTILGDKLYVFGGRRLSRTKPQLTSALYELDLIRRHWSKLETRGDIPPPRYFHSVCTLGDTKLVCYGGMSPASLSPRIQQEEAQAEVIVMSDIHIYDVPTRTWMKVASSDSPQGRYAHCAAILPSSAVFASANAPLSALHHNPAGANPNQGSLGIALDGTGGAEMVVVGGQDSANHYIEQISVFNLRSLKWTGTSTLGRSCGAYRSVVTPLTTMTAAQIGAAPHARNELEDEDDETPATGSGAPMLIYSNYNFLDVKLELQVRLTDGSLIEKPMQSAVSPPGLRFPNGGIIDNHFVVSGTFLTSSKQEYALWALDLTTLSWSRIDAGGSIFGQGSWNRGVLWSRRNAFVILGNRKRSLVDDYNNRRINFSNICLVELEAFGLYDNPRRISPTSGYVSISATPSQSSSETTASGRQLGPTAEDLGQLSLSLRELADMEFMAIDGTRIPVNSRLITRRWGPTFISLLRESTTTADTDTATLRPTIGSHPSRNSSVTITPSVSSAYSAATTLTNNTTSDLPDPRSNPPASRPRLFYLPHTVPTLHALLHYLYTSSLPPPFSPLATPQIFCSLLQFARPYKIDGLLEAVVEGLHKCLDGRNAAAIFNAAAMGAGGGDGVVFSTGNSVRDSFIPLRSASLAGLDGLTINGGNRGTAGLRINTDMANGRSTRNTLRPGNGNTRMDEDLEDDDVPGSASTTGDLSGGEASSLAGRHERRGEVWRGALSSVVGLQKRGLRGLMEGRRMRERGRSDGAEGARVGLGIA